MHIYTLLSAAVEGVEAYPVTVEVSRREAKTGTARTTVVGLPDAAVRESIDRVTPALFASGIDCEEHDHLVINLAPADRRKEGPVFDLAIALGLAASLPESSIHKLPDDCAFIAELALDGQLRPVRGALAAALCAKKQGCSKIIVAQENADECAIVDGIATMAFAHLRDVITAISSQWPTAHAEPTPEEQDYLGLNFSDVRGQEHAKRALAITATGAHNALMLGPPGSGKTMLAKRLPSILPPLSREEALEVTRIHSIAGALAQRGLITQRPFRSPHHNTSEAGLVGGGSVPRPGEVTMAQHGILFLDELPEFNRRTLEMLRQPLEDGFLTLSRAWGSLKFPSSCMLVAAMNPCPCGYLGHPTRACTDTQRDILRYRSRLSGPLLDRIDLHLEVPAQTPAQLDAASEGSSSEEIREKVSMARERMLKRQGCTNNVLSGRDLRKHAAIDGERKELLHQAIEELGLSARAHDRILRVARSIADYDNRSEIDIETLSEAIGYRLLDRQHW